MKKFICLVLFCTTVCYGFAQLPPFLKDSLDAYVAQGMGNWDVPGLSVVVVKNGQVVWMKGYGVRNIETKTTVDENTLFMIASNTKLFTGTALALLETRRKLDLNDRITKYFPDYRLYDSMTAQAVTVRDMLTHRIGTKPFRVTLRFGTRN